MGNLVDMKNELSDRFEKVHGLKMGLMSAFVKAATMALKETPAVNASMLNIIFRGQKRTN